MRPQRLSSRSTALVRALPRMWVAAVALVAWTVRTEARLLAVFVPVALIPWLALRGLLGRLCTVDSDGTALHVRRGRRTAVIPFSHVASVEEILGTGRNTARTVVVALRAATPLGREIRFAPRMRWLPDPEAIRRAAALREADPAAAASVLWESLSPADHIRQRMRSARPEGDLSGA